MVESLNLTGFQNLSGWEEKSKFMAAIYAYRLTCIINIVSNS